MADQQVYVELWVSLASLLRSYTAAHGLNGDRQATVELGEERIVVRRDDKWLSLERSGSRVTAMRENGESTSFELTEMGTLRSATGEQELDMAAEQWARELML